MRVLIVGNLGYIGSVLVESFSTLQPDAELIGYDIAYFANDFSSSTIPIPERKIKFQYYGDIRQFPEYILNDVDAVIYLAAISNDPMGNEFEQVTYDVNEKACIKLASLAHQRGIKHFVFASSCSVYGDADESIRTENSTVNPLTAYAKSKIQAEQGLQAMKHDGMIITCLRFATACGFSPRLRLDLVLNDFVANAFVNKKIKILSDGSPWRPLIHVKDMAKALIWASKRDAELGDFLVLNAGSNNFTYQVVALAKAIQDVLPEIDIEVNKAALPDKRSYQVDFSRFTKIAGNYAAEFGLKETIEDLLKGFQLMNFQDGFFQNSNYIRLNKLRGYLKNNTLTQPLQWSVS